MTLAIDIGNTNCKIGLFEKNELVEVFLNEEILSELLSRYNISHAIISKTGTNTAVENELHKSPDIKVLTLSDDLALPLQTFIKRLIHWVPTE